MIRATWRTARTHHRCEGGHLISPGDRYIEHAMSPYHDTIGGETWQRCAECTPCATRYGRTDPDTTAPPDTTLLPMETP